jgi:hypothetical protein
MRKNIFLTIILIIVLGVGYQIYLGRNTQKIDINVLTTSSCPPPPTSYTTHPPIIANQFTYPAIVSSSNNSWLMFTGGIVSQLPPSIIPTLPSNHIRFPLSQEEVWVSSSSDLNNWSKATPSLTILPETPVAFKQNAPYKNIYPDGFKLGCIGLTADTQCNAQINDPTAIRLNGSIYLYFTILENYRWYFGTVDGISAPLVNGGPSKPELQNIHSIGLAVSADDGKNWAFVEKVIKEHELDSDGNPILGAWAPSAITTTGNDVDVYFHDAFASKQYVAHLKGGASLTGIERINKSEGEQGKLRANLDVIRNGDYLEAVYNDASFSVSHTYFKSPSDFGLCPETIIVEGKNPDLTNMWPTPHQVIAGDKIHLFFSNFADRSYIPHWSRPTISLATDNSATTLPGDLNNDGRVDLFDYNLLIVGFGTQYSIFDYNNIVMNYGTSLTGLP